METEQIIYECVRCGKRATKKEWEIIENVFRCPACGFKVGKKVKPPIVKRIKAT